VEARKHDMHEWVSGQSKSHLLALHLIMSSYFGELGQYVYANLAWIHKISKSTICSSKKIYQRH
jgi:hypothetical protein